MAILSSVLHEIVLKRAKFCPKNRAVVGHGSSLSYSELAFRSGLWLQALYSCGVRPGDRVGIAMSRDCDLVAALLGILRAGCGYVPLDPNAPSAWLDYIASDAGISACVCDDELPGAFPDVVRVSRNALGKFNSITVSEPEVAADDTAYVLYTSGSTGRPKGVIVRHRNAVNLVDWARRTYTDEELQGVLAATSLGFDLSVFEIFVPLASGGTIVLVDGPLSLTEEPSPAPVTLINTVPSVMAELLRLRAVPSDVRVVNLAGEPLGASLAGTVYRETGARRVFNLYAPTETTTYSTFSVVKADELIPAIGRPIANTQVYVVDDAGALLPVGVEGEILIGGAGVTAGYVKLDHLTKERFVSIPYNKKWRTAYRTGDRGAWRPDGQLEFRGRADSQLKIRGCRIEPSHIEDRIRRIQGVADVAVVAQDFGLGDRRLAAYLVPLSASAADTGNVRNQLSSELPSFLIPTVWKSVLTLPRLASGKVDRQALADDRPPGSTASSTNEENICEVIAHEMSMVLNRCPVDARNDFFAAGGDSLLAARLACRLRDRLGLDLRPSHIFSARTPANLGAIIKEKKIGTVDDAVAPPMPRGDTIPLNSVQRDFWLHSRLFPSLPVHNVTFLLQWELGVKTKTAIEACHRISLRHPLLMARRVIDTTDGPEFDIQSGVKLAVSVVSQPSGGDDNVRCFAEAVGSEPFVLGKRPAWRVVLMAGKDGGCYGAILMFHHIIVDAASIDQVLLDFAAECFGRGGNTDDKNCLKRYRASLEELTRLLVPSQRQMEFWQNVWKLPRILQLPTDRARGASRSSKISRASKHLTGALPVKLEAAAKDGSTTLYVTVLAALAGALCRWCGHEEIVVASAFSLRDTSTFEEVLGCFINVLPLRIRVRKHQSWRDFVHYVGGLVAAAHEHKHCAPNILRSNGISSSTALHPTVPPILFGMLRSFEIPREAACTNIRVQEVSPSQLERELNAQVRMRFGEINLILEGREDLYSAETVRKILMEWADCLRAIATNGDWSVWPSSTRVDYREKCEVAADSSLFMAFDDVARKCEDHPAIATGSETWTYRKLRAHALSIAAALEALPTPGVCAVICSQPQFAVSAFLACARLGWIYVPLNTTYPLNRLRQITSIAGVSAVIADKEFLCIAASLVPASNVIDAESVPRNCAPCADCVARPDTIAYVLFTSGSTGTPKGVVQNHRNVLHHALTYKSRLALCSSDRLSLIPNIAYDAAVMDVFGAILSGACLCWWSVAKRGISGMGDWIGRESLTILHCTPSVYRAIVSSAQPTADFSSLRFVVLGGEPARRRDLEYFKMKHANECTLVNGYGPTESTLALQAFFRVDDTCAHTTLPIGHAVEGSVIALVGENGQEDVSCGEIEIRGPHIFLGYLSSPADWKHLSAVGVGERRHRTGDIARRLPDGQLIYVGRRDDQVKIAGIRVEPAEVEAELLNIDSIAEAVVLPKLGANEKWGLIAFVVPRSRRRITVGSVRRALSKTLPASMLPGTVVCLTKMPYLANGKIDRASLAMPPSADESACSDINRDELALAELWREVMQISELPKRGESFLMLGGTSLDALRVIEEAKRRLGVTLNPSDLLGDVRLSEVVSGMRRVRRIASPKAISETTRLSPIEDQTLSSQQLRFWFMDRAAPTTAGCRVVAALRFPAACDRTTMDRTLAGIIARHELLRSRFIEDDSGGVRRIVDPPRDLAIAWTRRTTLPSAPINPGLLPPEAIAPFDLSQDWPIRAFGIEASNGESLLVLIIHHIAADAWSVGVLTREISITFRSLRHGGRIDLPPTPSFHSTLQRAKSRLGNRRKKAQLAFWKKELQGAPSWMEFASERPRSCERILEGIIVSTEISADICDKLRAFCACNSLTPTAVLLSIFALVLTRYIREDEVVIGLPVNLRELPTEGTVIGPLLNTVAIRCNTRGAHSFAELAKAIRDRIASALDHAEVPFELVVDTIAPSRDATRHPVYQAVFSYHREMDMRTTFLTDEPVPIEASSGTVTCDISLTAVEHKQLLRCDLESPRGLIDPRLLRRFIEEIVHTIAIVLATPDTPVAEIEVLPQKHRQELIERLGSVASEPREENSFFASFERHVSRTPTETAVVAPDSTLSYSELASRAAAVAAALKLQGVGQNSFVPIVTGDTCNMVTAILGVLATGAAFVPIAASSPQLFLRQACEDTGATIALSCVPGFALDIPTIDLAELPGKASSLKGLFSRVGDGIMYAIYTSGTSGKPKAAMGADRGILNRFRWMTSFFGGSVPPITLQTTPAIYDSAVWQLLWPLTLGGRCIIPKREALLDPLSFARLVSDNDISVVDFVPSVLSALLPELERAEQTRDDLKSLRWVIVGGESFRPNIAAHLWRLLPWARIVNLYGPTEASIGCIHFEIVDEPIDRVPIGRPIPNVRVVLLDRLGRLVPRGAVGELWLLGDCVGPGYLGSHQEKGGFTPIPLPERCGERAFRTCDLARWNEQGNLEFHGRTDGQLKVRGVRIEPGGIQTMLESHASIQQAYVTVRTDPESGIDLLIAYVRPTPGRENEVYAIRGWLRERLPAAFVPDRIEQLDNLPVGISGKQDQRLFPNPQRISAYRASPIAERIAAIWTVILRHGVGHQSNFFDVGGHSLLLLTLRHRLENEFQCEVSIIDLFQNPTIEAQAELIAFRVDSVSRRQ